MSKKSGEKGSGKKRPKFKAHVAKSPVAGMVTSPGKPGGSAAYKTGSTRDKPVPKQVPPLKQIDPASQVLPLRQVLTVENAPRLTPVPALKPFKQLSVVKPVPPLNLGRRVLQISLIVATLVGGFAVLFPRATVNASDPVDPEDPFSSLITIANTGYIPLLSVTLHMALGKVIPRNAGVGLEGAPNYTTRINYIDWTPRTLDPDDKYTISLNQIFHLCREGVASADIAIVVEYELPLIHLKVERLYPFAIKSQTNGSFYWYSDSRTPPARFSFPSFASPATPNAPPRSLPALERSSSANATPVLSARLP
jgi:hypothetical protein